MKKRATIAHFEPQYEAFLFASVGDDRNGMPLAVASLLGRMNLDPWHEAAALAVLPAKIAAQKLASLIEAMPEQRLQSPECAALAARLVALLPAAAAARSEAPWQDPVTVTEAQTKRTPLVYAIWFLLLCILVLGVAFGRAGTTG